MKEISTRHTEYSAPVMNHAPSDECRRSGTGQGQVVYLAGLFTNYIWNLICGRIRPYQAALASEPAVASRPVRFVGRVMDTLRGMPKLDLEPPDIPDPSPPDYLFFMPKEAYHLFEQRPMNEQFILNDPPQSTAPIPDAGGGPTDVRAHSSGGSSFNRLLSSIVGYAQAGTMPVLKGALSVFTLLMVWLVSVPAQAQAQGTINLSLKKKISTQSPAIGDVVTYTIIVANAPGSATATGVSVKDNLPVGGVSYLPNSATVVRGTGTFTAAGSATATTGSWSIPSVAPGDSAVLVLKATVLERGVWFNTAEITAADQTDSNSIPNNQSLVEDDYVAVCFSVPILLYTGDEYTVTIPSGYDQIVWYRNDVPISTSAISTSLAEVNGDLSLTIKSGGTYRFVTYRNGCPATNCCDIQVIDVPLAGLGDYVFLDANKDGIQNAGDSPIGGVVVTLYINGVASATTTTASSGTATGFYSFTGLTPGNSLSYSVGFVAPTGFTTTTPLSGTDKALDSDADPITGRTASVTLAPGEFNPTLDAGFYLPTASLGDYVFADNNKDGIQDAGDTPIPGVVVVLLDGTNTPIRSTTTNASGLYSFTGLTPGVPYSVSFVTPTGYTSTSAQVGGDDTKDSDANPITGQTRSVTLAPGENNPNLDAGFYIPTAGLGDYVFVDANKNGIQDGGDSPIPGVVVVLLNGANSPIASTTTNASGFYFFTGLTPGIPYSVSFVAPTGYTSTSALIGGDDTKDSDADPITGQTRSVTLANGEFNPNLDAGFYLPTASLGDYVFADNNKDGIQDAGDTPIPGAVVVLLDGTNTPIRSTTTNASGLYSFTGLTPGVPYSVSFVTPTGYVSTTAQVGGDDTKDSDANPVTGQTRSVTLAPGENNMNLDAGFYIPTAGLGDYVFVDANKNGIQDGGDSPIPGVVVVLLNGANSPIASTTTNASGFYSFTGLTPGVPYSVSFVAPVGFVSTSALVGGNDALDSDADPITGQTRSVTLANGEFNPNLDAGFYLPSASLGDYVFADNNKDGIQNTGDTPILGVVVVLLDGTNTPIRSTTTSATGMYSFTGLTPGVPYSVSFVTPTGYVSTTAQVGGDDTKDSDANPITGQTRSVTLAPGENNPNLDAGFYIPTAGLGDYVFVDANKNGIQDGGDSPIPGVVVVLLNGANSPIASTTTNASGFYSFTGLTPGVPYSVSFVTPTGYVSTSAGVGGNDALDSDANPITGKTRSVTLANGEFNPNLDAGFYLPTASLGDYVFADNNKDGIQDAGDTPIPGVVVLLCDANNTPIRSTTTNASGLYSFTGLTPGVPYSVSFVTPTGYTSTSAQVGGDDTKDSDANPVTGKTRSVTLAPGENNPNLDAGFVPNAVCPTEADFNLMVSVDAKICNGESTTLIASSPVPNAKICWYLTPYAGTALNSLDSGQPFVVNPTTTTVYYAEVVTTVNGVTCVSGRKPVVVEVTTVPTPICLGNIKNTCPATTVDLTKIQIENQTTGLTYEWYTSLNRSEATRVTNLTAVGAGKFYLFARSGRCYSNPTVLTVEIVDCNCQFVAGVNVGPGVSVCAGDVIPLRAVLSGSATSVVWASNGTGTFSNPTSLTTTYTPSASDVATGNVLLTATTNDPDGPGGVCQAANSSLIAQINKRPDAPIGVACDDTLVCQGSSTKLIGFAPGAKINWYDQDGKLVGTTQSGGKLVVTPSKAGAVVYFAEAVTEAGCASPRTSLTITVGTCLADLAVLKKVVTPAPYSVGQKITYAITVTNNGPITGTSVTVKDALPASLSYVSATPVGQYNPATGVWTIGTLTAGSDRSLLVEATVVGAGSITNTAIVGGSNNDPRYPQNDTARVTIEVEQCIVKAPTVVCAITEICKGGTTTLSARGCGDGTVLWSDGKTGETIFVSPNITTTYTASCVSGKCVSPASNPIKVTVLDPQMPVITASADNVCPGTSVTLTASGCEGGTIEWSEKAQMGASIVVTPNGKTTYTAQCRLGSCLSRPAEKTINISSDIPTPVIVCSTTVVCPGETVTLTVENCLGTPVWNSTTATTSSIVVTPTVGNNSYSVYCKNGACVSKSSPVYVIKVVAPVIPTITASADTVCAGGLVTLTATGCNGDVVWNVAGKTGASITVNPTANISYYAQCKFRTCLSEPSNTVNIVVASPAAPIVKVNKTLVCSGDLVSLTATGCNGTVQWQGVDKVGASIDIYPTETKEYFAVCKQGACISEPSNKVRVTVNTTPGQAPVVTASATSICNSGVVSLSATGCSGTVKWSDGQTGPVVSVTVTPTNREFYAICTPTSGTACGSGKSNIIRIDVTPAPTPVVTCSTSEICPGESVVLTVSNCQGIPYWSSTDSHAASITVTPSVTTDYSVYCQDGACKSATSINYTIKVTPVTVPTVTASATTVTAGGLVTLTASGCNGEVIWSANDINGNNKGASIVVMPTGTQTYYAQCRFRECLSGPSATITINPGDCIAKAGTLVAQVPTVCGGSSTTVLISATPNGGLVVPAGYSVQYLLTKGGVIVDNMAIALFTVPSDPATYTIHTLVYNDNPSDKNYLNLSLITKGVTTASDLVALIGTKCAALDATGATVNVSVVNPPVVLPGKSVTVCNGGIASLTATGCDGGTVTWSDGTVGAVYARPIYASQSLMATCTLNGCTSQPSNLVDVVLGTPTVPIIVTDKMSVCIGETVSLTATGCEGGQYIWSDGTTVGSTLTITPTADVSFRVKCKVGTCEGDWSATTTIKVGAPATPTVSILGANGSTTVCFGAPVTLVAEGCSADSYVTWSNNQVGNSITVSPANSATFTAQCCTSNYCKSTPSNVLSVTVLKKVPQPVVTDITNTCPMLTADLAKAISSSAATTGGLFEYYTDATLSDAAKVADPAHVGSGTFYVVEKTTNGCTSLPVMIHVQITTCGETTPCDATNPATADAGPDASVCAAKVYQLAGVMGGAGKTAHWTTSGSGTFDNAFALSAKYTASAEDVLSGKVTLTLSVSTNNAACPVAKDDLLLTIDGIKSIPVVTVAGSTNLCFGDSVTLKAPAGAAGYKWSNNATTQNIVVKTSGTYSVQLLDGTGCSSVMSEGVTVKVNEPVMMPLVHNLRNTCPAKIVDLTTAVTKLPGLSYTYRICECVTSNIVMRPDSVCEGHYWVVAKNEAGCVSAPAKIEVKVFNCAADTLTADVSIAKLASTAVVNNGAPVAYTVKVTNAGPHTAKNIDVRDILPAGLELVPAQTADYKVSNGAIMKHIDSLKAGESVEIMYAARVTVKGKDVVNMAEITYLDNKDPNLANNTSSVTVKDTTTRRHSLIGLAKAVLGQPVAMGDSLIKVAYKFTVTNFGDDTLTHVNVGDDLAYTFGANTVTNAALALSGTSMLKLNPAFTGVGGNTQMLDSTSHIAPGKSAMFTLNVTVKRAAGDTTKSFNNFAMATAMNSMTTVSDLSVSGGDADPDNDGDPTNNTSAASFTLGTAQPQGPSIGLALAVVKTEMQPDSSFNVTYKATIKNFGDVALNGVVLTDSLIRAFAAPVSYSVVGAPMVGAGSTLVANTTFNGESQPNILTEASSLAAGVQDTVRITVNVKTNGNNGPFYSSATVVAHTPDMSQTVKDISNNGFDPAPAGSVSTTVRFDLPKGLIGVAKSVGTPTLVEEGVFDIPYTISVCNLGQVPLKKIQVVDKLSETFGNGALIVSSRVAITGTGAGASTLMIDSLYTGQGLITNMLVDSMSTLAVGAKAYLTFTVRVNVKNADSLTFYNTAMATALTPDNGMVEDASTAGTNDDPDNDLDPRNNSQPTPVTLNGLSTTSYMGLAMAVRDTARQADGSYNVTYQIVVKAYGPDPLRNVTVSDTLSKVFNAQTGSNFSVVNTPIITSTGSALKLNLNYNGGTDPVLVLGDSTSTLAAGKADTILVVVNVVADGSTSTFLNSAYGSALAKTGRVSDVSTSGLNPDLNGNGNPTDANEREATPLNLQPVFATVFIPQGFSPNGDGINDLFVIRGANGQTVSLEVYNRWGHMVYKNDDYQNDWDGKPNTGIAVGSDANGVPDGTYYYVINLSDGRKFVRYMTINR